MNRHFYDDHKMMPEINLDEQSYLVRYYDNDERQFTIMKEICNNIESIHVKEEVSEENKNMLNSNYAYNYNKIHPDNRFAKFLLNFDKSKPYIEEYISDGLTQNQIINLVTWAVQNSTKKKIVLFDWDRTLSHTEGIVCAQSFEEKKLVPYTLNILSDFDKKKFYSEMLAYCLGPKRNEEIIKMFSVLRLYNTDIFILTNNRSCSQSLDYISMMNILDVDRNHLLCSAGYSSKAKYLKQIFGSCLELGAVYKSLGMPEITKI